MFNGHVTLQINSLEQDLISPIVGTICTNNIDSDAIISYQSKLTKREVTSRRTLRSKLKNEMLFDGL